MNLEYYSSLINAGLPLWVLCGGALLCFFLDALSLKHGEKAVYGLAVLTIILSLWAAARQWLGGAHFAHDLILTDRLTLFFVFLSLFTGLLSLFNISAYFKVGGAGQSDNLDILPGALVSLVLFSLVGMIFLFASDHLIVNFLGLETMSLAIYVLVGSNRRDLRSNEAAMKYYITGSVASAMFLYGVALVHGAYGSFQLSELVTANASSLGDFLPKLGFTLMLMGFLFKIGIAPFHFWTPDAYEGAPVPVTGYMATGVKVGAFAFFIRVLDSLHFMPFEKVQLALTVCAVLTLLVGNLGALRQDNLKRMLAYSSISHGGYLLIGIIIGFGDKGFDISMSSAVLFYLIGYSFMTLGAFAVLSVMVQEKKEVTQFSDLEGLGYSRPVLAALFSLFLLSLLGIPPTVGFIGKYAILSAAVAQGHVALAVFGILMSLVSAYYYLRPMVVMYFGGEAKKLSVSHIPFAVMFVLVFCALAVLYMGTQPTDYLKMAEVTASLFK